MYPYFFDNYHFWHKMVFQKTQSYFFFYLPVCLSTPEGIDIHDKGDFLECRVGVLRWACPANMCLEERWEERIWEAMRQNWPPETARMSLLLLSHGMESSMKLIIYQILSLKRLDEISVTFWQILFLFMHCKFGFTCLHPYNVAIRALKGSQHGRRHCSKSGSWVPYCTDLKMFLTAPCLIREYMKSRL